MHNNTLTMLIVDNRISPATGIVGSSWNTWSLSSWWKM